jgi:two-component system sensor histidine kinase KdpD
MGMTAPKPSVEDGAPAVYEGIDQDRDRLHRQIFSSISHDLKTPLASIIGSLEIYERMIDRLSPAQQKSLIGVALQEAYRLDNFVTNILDMAKLENGMVKLRHEIVVIDRLIDDCIMRLGNRLKGTDICIERPSESLIAKTDATLLGRVLCLVLDNAVKYGGKPGTIRIISGFSENKQGYIHIADNGAGIPESQIERIFEKYTRFAHGDQQNAGTGLGLTICRQIMGLLDGSVSATNGEQHGAIFTLYFPIS